MKRPLLIISLILALQVGYSQTWQDTANIISKHFDRYKPNNPGCQLSISLNGKIIFSKAWGLADIERNVPYSTETVTEAGSITKQFTAAAVLLLEQQGKLSLHDDVRKFVPELPNYGQVIHLEQLLHHTSGLREWSDLEAITGWPRTYKAYNNDDVLNMLCRQARLNNLPGNEYIYSNSNYLLLTFIIERVTGMKLADFTKQYIFTPAGMTHTSWRDDFKKVVPNRGIAYIKRDGNYIINMPNENVYGPGALLTTTDDLLKWTNFILSNKLGNPGLLVKQLALEKIPGGAEPNYAAGLFIGDFEGYKIISHTGQTAGYIGAVESLPELGLSVAWLSNTTEFRDSLYTGIDAVNNLFIKNTAPAVTKKVVAAAVLPVVKIKQYEGWYRSEKTNKGVKIILQHNMLVVNNTALVPLNETTFKYDESELKFISAGRFTLTTPDKATTGFTKESTAQIIPAYLRQFTGTWYSKETESSFKIIIKDGKLLLEANYLKDVVLSPTYNNAFNFKLDVDSDMQPVDANIVFEKGGKKQVVQCLVSMNDARGIKFIKTKQ